MGGAATAVYLSHPPNWEDNQKGAFLGAAARDGIPNPQLVATPVAAAQFLNGMDPLPLGSHLLVVDVGVGELTITVV